MLHEYNWLVLFAALIIPGGFIALGMYHIIKLVLRYRIRARSEPQRLAKECSGTLYLVQDFKNTTRQQETGQ